MRVVINGEQREIADGLTVSALAEQLGMRTDRLAIELNRDILPRERWPHTPLRDDDHLEIVHFVGGG